MRGQSNYARSSMTDSHNNLCGVDKDRLEVHIPGSAAAALVKRAAPGGAISKPLVRLLIQQDNKNGDE